MTDCNVFELEATIDRRDREERMAALRIQTIMTRVTYYTHAFSYSYCVRSRAEFNRVICYLFI